MVSAIEVVRTRPAMYVGVEVPRAFDIAQKIIYQLLLLHETYDRKRKIVLTLKTKPEASTTRWAVVSDFDWMRNDDDKKAMEYFTTIVPFREDGANSMRSEILVTAFAQDVVFFRKGRALEISEQADSKAPVESFGITIADCAILFTMK